MDDVYLRFRARTNGNEDGNEALRYFGLEVYKKT